MTPEYITGDMTWPEIGSALEYVYRFVEPIPASKSGRKYQTMSAYLVRGRDTFRNDMGNLRRTVRGK